MEILVKGGMGDIKVQEKYGEIFSKSDRNMVIADYQMIYIEYMLVGKEEYVFVSVSYEVSHDETRSMVLKGSREKMFSYIERKYGLDPGDIEYDYNKAIQRRV